MNFMKWLNRKEHNFIITGGSILIFRNYVNIAFVQIGTVPISGSQTFFCLQYK